jgi:hypothetical protein
MEENKVEEIVEETTQPKVDATPEVKEEPKENVTKVDLSKNWKSTTQEQTVHKVDLSKPPAQEESEEVKEEKVETKVEEVENATPTQEQEKPQQEASVVEEITGEVEEKVDEIAGEAEEAIAHSQATGTPLPEKVQKLIDFMNETGGDLVDYVKLSQDYSSLDDTSLLREYYKQTKTHLDDEEINFLMEDNFSFDEDVDDEREIRRKKLALKEQVASAKSHLDGLKSRYYEELKAGSRLTPEQQKAQDFFNRYKKTTEESKKRSESLNANFNTKTDNFFGEEFKGFEFNVGDKRFRYNVNNANEIKTTQSNVNNFIGKFLNEKTGALEDAAGYHKSLFTAMNPDAIAKHFYDQGKADAMKNSVAKSKNISMDPRQSHGEAQNTGGPKFKVLGDDSASFKWKIKNKN